MATFGQGINPQFGAIDYSPILKGSVAGAEMAAKGGQMIGQGLANLGQEVGQGIQKYAEQKKKNAERDGRVNTAIGSLQAIAKTMDKYGRKDEAEALRLAGYNLIQEPNLDKRAAMADTAIGSFLQGQQIETGARQRQLGEQAAQYVRAATQAGGNLFSAVVKDAAGGYSPMSAEAQALGEKQMLERKYMQSQINKNDADRPIGTAPTEYTKWTKNWLNDWSARNKNQEPTAAAIVQADQAWKTSNQPTVPNPVTASIFNDLITQRLPLQQSINSYSNNTVTQLLDSGQLFTGTGANVKLAGAKILKAAGFSNFDNEILNTERLAALLVQPTIALAKQLGANPSDYDAKLLSKAQAGDIVYDDATIKALNKARQDIIDSGVKQHNQRIDDIYPANNPDFAQQRAAARLYGNTKSKFTIVEKQ
jgi:hypothetical protein